MSRCAIQKVDGSYINVLKNASLLHDNNGKVIGAVETLTDISELLKKDTQIEAFRRELSSRDGFHGILGDSGSMQQVFDLITNAARSDAPVIVFGESGTGKELVAAAIHNAGTRRISWSLPYHRLEPDEEIRHKTGSKTEHLVVDN